jgi:hypothetical protein
VVFVAASNKVVLSVDETFKEALNKAGAIIYMRNELAAGRYLIGHHHLVREEWPLHFKCRRQRSSSRNFANISLVDDAFAFREGNEGE